MSYVKTFSNLLTIKFIYIALFLLLISLIALLMLSISLMISNKFFSNQEKTSEYECGFEPFDSATRQPFEIHFFIVGVIFLIFDVEIALLIP